MANVMNGYGVEINFDAAVNMMDDEIRESLSMKMAPCTDQEFFDAYEKKHMEVFEEEWELSKKNPCW